MARCVYQQFLCRCRTRLGGASRSRTESQISSCLKRLSDVIDFLRPPANSVAIFGRVSSNTDNGMDIAQRDAGQSIPSLIAAKELKFEGRSLAGSIFSPRRRAKFPAASQISEVQWPASDSAP